MERMNFASAFSIRYRLFTRHSTLRCLSSFFNKPSFRLLHFPTLPVVKFTNQTLRISGFFHRLQAVMAATSFPPTGQVRDTIELTPKEEQIFNCLLNVLRYFELQTQLRVAGGWVRDKLLGKECYDIDIALDNMLGREFCEKVNEYLLTRGEETHGIGVIQCNPEQSKHLETARMHIFDMWIDFVNLRSEDYSENTRIPTMRFGTAEEDAYRRDLTINSLFYNINTSSVEDFTGRGIADLKSGKIVTPLPPKETFLDDPLRVLRAIRFGARLEFMLDEELKKAAADEVVRTAIADKISRERIGHEVDLMMSGSQPVKAMIYVSDLLLSWVVFGLPPTFEPPISEGCDRLCITYMFAAWRLMEKIGCSNFSDEQRRLSLYAALFLPLRKTVYRDGKGRMIPVTNYIFRNSLKLKSSDAERVGQLHDAIKKFISLIPFVISNEDACFSDVNWKVEIIDVPAASKQRILLGLLLREIKDFWRAAVLLSTLLYPSSLNCASTTSDEHLEWEKRRELYEKAEEWETRRELYEKIVNTILRLDLDKVWEVKPLLNGRDIMSVLQLETGGPLVKEWQKKLLKWQLAHPLGTTEECVDWMRQTDSKRARIE